MTKPKVKKSKPKRTPQEWCAMGYTIGVTHNGVKFHLTPDNYKTPLSKLAARQKQINAEREKMYRDARTCKCPSHWNGG